MKSPKVYLHDSGLLHALLGVGSEADLLAHPKVGASWEGFILGQTIRRLGAQPQAFDSLTTQPTTLREKRSRAAR